MLRRPMLLRPGLRTKMLIVTKANFLLGPKIFGQSPGGLLGVSWGLLGVSWGLVGVSPGGLSRVSRGVSRGSRSGFLGFGV